MTTTERRVIAGRYELLNRIGAGGMADVFKAADRVLDRHVAVKILSPRLASDPAFVQRFKREAQAAASLNDPNIVAVYDWGADASLYFMVMELVEGETLEDVLQRRGRLPEHEALPIAEQVAAALEAAHRRSVVHRDVKPHNILIGFDGQVKVADFGIARALGAAQITEANTVFGTVQYVSPEQAQNGPVDARSDLYSLGVVLYELLTGQVPFAGDSPMAVAWQHVHQAPEPPRRLVPAISPATSALVMRALEKDPAARFQSAAEMREAIGRVVRGEHHPTAAVAAPALNGASATTQVLPALAGAAALEGALADRTATRAVQAAPAAAAPAPVAPAAASHVAARPRRSSSVALLFTLLRIMTLLAVALLSVVGAVFLFRPDVGAALARSAAQAMARVQAAPPPRPVPAVSPSAVATTRPAPSPTTARQAAAPTVAPSPSVRPTTAPPTAARPTAAPPTPVPPTQAPVVAAGDPVQAVIGFYTLVAEHQFDQAAHLWSARMQANYPPDENIDHRFAATRSIGVNSAQVVAMDQGAGAATVAVDLTEVSGDPPTTHHLMGTWRLVRGPSGWLLDQPNF